MLTYHDIDYYNAIEFLKYLIRKSFLTKSLKDSNVEFFLIIRGSIGKDYSCILGAAENRRDLRKQMTTNYLTEDKIKKWNSLRIIRISEAIESTLKKLFEDES